MSKIIELPNGETAVLKSDEELTNKEIKQIQRSSRVAASIIKSMQDLGYKDEDPDAWKIIADMPDDEYDSIDLFQRTCVIVRLKSWTLDQPLPATPDEVDDLPMSIYTPLTVAAVQINFTQDFGLEGATDPKVDTED